MTLRKNLLAAGIMGLLMLSAGELKAAETRFMNLAAPPGTSNFFPYWVAVAKAVQNAYPEFKINVSESQSSVDIIRKIRADMAPVGNCQSNTDYDNYNGLGLFKDKPNKEARILWYYEESPIQFIVLEDANIKNLRDLDGKRFNPGAAGGATALVAKQILDCLEVKPKYFEAGQASASDAVSNRQIVGTVKTGNILGPDSYLLQIKANVPVDLVSMTPEEQQAVHKKYPYFIPWTIPAGFYDWITHDTLTVKVSQGATSTTKLSQEDGYKMIAAILSPEGKKLVDSAYPNGAGLDILKLTLEARTPLHAGTVQYMHEKNIDVPAELIPAEYRKK